MVDLAPLRYAETELKRAFETVFQGRSAYQLEKFVVQAHEHSERRYAQCVLELQQKYFAIRRADVDRRRLAHEMEQSACPFEREAKALDIEQLNLALGGAMREFATLYALFRQMPAYTADELEAAEAGYWATRLARQAQQDIDATGVISVGNQEALRQAGILDSYAERFAEIVGQHPGAIRHVCSD